MIAERSQTDRQQHHGVFRITALSGGGSIKQRIEPDMPKQAKDAECKSKHHRDDEQHGNAVHSAGRMPDEGTTDDAGEDGSEPTVERTTRQMFQCATHTGGIGIKQDAADKIHGEIDDVDLWAKHIARYRIKRSVQVIVLVGFKQQPAGKRHHDHRHHNHNG